MTAPSPLAQYPWSLVIGAVIGMVIVLGLGVRGLRRTGALGWVALAASALTGASAGALVAMGWLWTGPMDRPVACLYSCAEMQFLSNEQFRQIMIITDLAWILPVATLFFGAMAVWTAAMARRL